MTNQTLPKMQVKAFGLVRDKSGKPKIDGDPKKLPQPIKDAMTEAEFTLAVLEYEGKTYG